MLLELGVDLRQAGAAAVRRNPPVPGRRSRFHQARRPSLSPLVCCGGTQGFSWLSTARPAPAPGCAARPPPAPGRWSWFPARRTGSRGRAAVSLVQAIPIAPHPCPGRTGSRPGLRSSGLSGCPHKGHTAPPLRSLSTRCFKRSHLTHQLLVFGCQLWACCWRSPVSWHPVGRAAPGAFRRPPGQPANCLRSCQAWISFCEAATCCWMRRVLAIPAPGGRARTGFRCAAPRGAFRARGNGWQLRPSAPVPVCGVLPGGVAASISLCPLQQICISLAFLLAVFQARLDFLAVSCRSLDLARQAVHQALLFCQSGGDLADIVPPLPARRAAG